MIDHIMGNPRTKHVEFPADHNTLRWHQMGVMASHITGNMTICSTFYAANNERNTKGMTSLALCQGNAPLSDGFPDKGPVMQTVYPVVTSSFIDVDQTAEIWQPGTVYSINLFLFCFVPFWLMSGPRLNIKTVLSTYGNFHVQDKTAVRTSYL